MKYFILIAMLGITTAPSHMNYECPSKKLSFKYPENFSIGRYEENPILNVQYNQILIVEKDILEKINVNSIPVGSIPLISVSVKEGERADYLRSFHIKDDYKKDIHERTVYQLPGFPGLTGEKAYYYLIPVTGKVIVEITAHKYYINMKNADGNYKPTNYDKIIEDYIIKNFLYKN